MQYPSKEIPNRTSIHELPKEADGRRFSDLEMDTIVGRNNKGAIVTIIDRSTDWLLMRKLPHGKDAFADPHVPWQKGGIENTNGLIRQTYQTVPISRM